MTGSVGRGDSFFRLCGTRDFRPRRTTGATLRAGVGWKECATDRDTPPKRWRQPRPGDRRGNLPPWDRWSDSPDAGRTLRAGEQDGSAQNRRARSAGSSPIAYLKHRRPGAPRPLGFYLPHAPGESRGIAGACGQSGHTDVRRPRNTCSCRKSLNRNGTPGHLKT